MSQRESRSFLQFFLHLKSTDTDQRVRSPHGLPAGLLRPPPRPPPEEGHQRRNSPPEGGGAVEEAQDQVFSPTSSSSFLVTPYVFFNFFVSSSRFTPKLFNWLQHILTITRNNFFLQKRLFKTMFQPVFLPSDNDLFFPECVC